MPVAKVVQSSALAAMNAVGRFRGEQAIEVAVAQPASPAAERADQSVRRSGLRRRAARYRLESRPNGIALLGIQLPKCAREA
jgi:hypothetical protein